MIPLKPYESMSCLEVMRLLEAAEDQLQSLEEGC